MTWATVPSGEGKVPVLHLRGVIVFYSHLWENFVREAREGHQWLHEQSSIEMLQFIIEENNLMPIFEDYGLTDRDITFVKVPNNLTALFYS